MLSRKNALGIVLAALLLSPLPLSADTVYLAADFDDKTVGLPIGTGGPDVGEPTSVASYISAVVRDTPFPTPCLQIADADDLYAGVAEFKFLGDVEITSGVVALTANFWFTLLSPGYSFQMIVRERDGSAQNFTSVRFQQNGSVRYADANTGAYTLIGSLETGRSYQVAIVHDLDAGTYDIYLDRQLVLADEDHGIFGSGIGKVSFGCVNDQDMSGYYYIDDIMVSDSYDPTPVAAGSWGKIKALYR